eukprot:TRINITY_DN5471_c0_g2_i1.p1 TRINITY_DN5471_c0_g2~~TRINITY_DN5471_c0_g2_i1.p1  ORF type:complete len:660 (+),score=146.90 TRINITY_DN5471_c0_g2_i1:203-2182(+)
MALLRRLGLPKNFAGVAAAFLVIFLRAGFALPSPSAEPPAAGEAPLHEVHEEGHSAALLPPASTGEVHLEAPAAASQAASEELKAHKEEHSLALPPRESAGEVHLEKSAVAPQGASASEEVKATPSSRPAAAAAGRPVVTESAVEIRPQQATGTSSGAAASPAAPVFMARSVGSVSSEKPSGAAADDGVAGAASSPRAPLSMPRSVGAVSSEKQSGAATDDGAKGNEELPSVPSDGSGAAPPPVTAAPDPSPPRSRQSGAGAFMSPPPPGSGSSGALGVPRLEASPLGAPPGPPSKPKLLMGPPPAPLQGGAHPMSPPDSPSVVGGRAIPFAWRGGGTLLAATGALLAALVLGGACLALGFVASSALWQRSRSGAIRNYIEELPVCRKEDISWRLPARGGYDCMLSRPLSSKQLVRIEAFVQQPPGGCLLTAPLTQQRCVYYSTVVSRKVHDCVHPVPEAYASSSLDFSVALAEDPHQQIDVYGKDISLFDMRDGTYKAERHAGNISDTWMSFIAAHRTAPHLSPMHNAQGGPLEFQESALLVGALVTLVGELHREPHGALSLRPLAADGINSLGDQRERWRTSWESAGAAVTNAAVAAFGSRRSDPETQERKIEKVLVSDDRQLLTRGGGYFSAKVPLFIQSFTQGIFGSNVGRDRKM